MIVDNLLHLCHWHKSYLSIDSAVAFDVEESGYRLHTACGSKVSIAVDVNLEHINLAKIVDCQLVQRGSKGLAGAAP